MELGLVVFFIVRVLFFRRVCLGKDLLFENIGYGNRCFDVI